MNQRLASSLISAAACGCLALPALAQQEPPNLIFILTDDMGLEAIRWAGDEGKTHERIFTDNLSAMSAQGVSFTRCRVNPNCSPTRACLMTGRSALDNGVVGVIGRYNPLDEPGNPCESLPLDGPPAQVTNRLGLQTQERTIAEVLQDMGYYTILIDKWHLGYNEGIEPTPEDRGLLPTQQGFHVSYDWMATICEDEPLEVGDEHMVDAYEWAVNVVNNRPWVEGQPMPYALFFHTITPHRRHDDGDTTYGQNNGFQWWRVHEQLCPISWDRFGQRYVPDVGPNNGGNVIRFIQNVEAIDTVIRALLISLDVIQNDPNRTYRDESETIVFFLGDNGTDHLVSTHGAGRAKNSTFEGGIRVPLFVMGEGITDTELENTENTRLINHVDFYYSGHYLFDY